jgi:hypothetical protein
VSQPADDPRARFRHLPEPVRPEDLVETVDADPPPLLETPWEDDARWLRAAGGGTP